MKTNDNQAALAVLSWCGLMGHTVICLDSDANGGLRSRLHTCNVEDARRTIIKDGYRNPQIWVRDGKTRDGKRKWKQGRLSVSDRLKAHLACKDATANDSETDALYREAMRIPADVETDLESVETWAHSTLNK